MVVEKYLHVVLNANGEPIAVAMNEFDAHSTMRDYERYHCDHNSCKIYKVELVGDHESKK